MHNPCLPTLFCVGRFIFIEETQAIYSEGFHRLHSFYCVSRQNKILPLTFGNKFVIIKL